MGKIEPELLCPAPRHARLRTGFHTRFAVLLALFLVLGGAPLIHVARQIRAFEVLQQQGQPMRATIVRRFSLGIGEARARLLVCAYENPSGKRVSAWLSVNRSGWDAFPPGSRATITACDELPGQAALGAPNELHLSTALGLGGYATLAAGMTALLMFGSRLRPYFRDLTLVSLGTPAAGKIVGKSWKGARRWGRVRAVPMIHFHFKDPYGVERVRTQIVSGSAWANAQEGDTMTVLFCARRRGLFAAYPLLLAEAVRAFRPANLTVTDSVAAERLSA